MREGTGYKLPALTEQDRVKIGFVFCPEYGGARPVEIGTDIWLFGPEHLPEAQRGIPSIDTGGSVTGEKPPAVAAIARVPPAQMASAGLEAVDLLLGHRDDGEPVHWRVGIQGNPHLLIVGLPGMGKTTCLIQLCTQLQESHPSPPGTISSRPIPSRIRG